MSEERLLSPGKHFGAGWVKGLNNFFPDLPPQERLKVLGILDSCPNPDAVAAANGRDWTINRYTECNLVDGFMMEQADQINPKLAGKLRGFHFRPLGEKPYGYNPKAIPVLYRFMVLAGSNPVRYAASRVTIEEFGRKPPWKIGDPRVSRGMLILKASLQDSRTPEEFLARLANGVIAADADKDAVLGHIFATELEEEGTIFLAKKVAKEVKIHAPELWQHYKSLSIRQKIHAGITTVSLEN